ncbi:MAG: hypothetical protein ACK4ZJ_18600, partial [Allorhizobium sp.]
LNYLRAAQRAACIGETEAMAAVSRAAAARGEGSAARPAPSAAVDAEAAALQAALSHVSDHPPSSHALRVGAALRAVAPSRRTDDVSRDDVGRFVVRDGMGVPIVYEAACADLAGLERWLLLAGSAIARKVERSLVATQQQRQQQQQQQQGQQHASARTRTRSADTAGSSDAAPAAAAAAGGDAGIGVNGGSSDEVTRAESWVDRQALLLVLYESAAAWVAA